MEVIGLRQILTIVPITTAACENGMFGWIGRNAVCIYGAKIRRQGRIIDKRRRAFDGEQVDTLDCDIVVQCGGE